MPKQSAGIIWTDKSLFKSVPLMAAKVDAVISGVMDYEANEAQSFMRINASWTDRTGNARQGLFARPGRDAGKHFIVLYHTMPYGIYLETRWNGKYAIIVPATQQAGRNVMSSLRKAFSMMGGAKALG